MENIPEEELCQTPSFHTHTNTCTGALSEEKDDGVSRAVHPQGLSRTFTENRTPHTFAVTLVACFAPTHTQGEDPDEINRLDEMIAEGAFGAVYKVCLPHTNRLSVFSSFSFLIAT